MPWTLVISLIIFTPLAGINFYVGRVLYWALTAQTNWNKMRVRWAIVLGLTSVNLLSPVFLVAYLIAGRAVVPAFAGDVFLIDLFLTYPFWIALIITFQLFILYSALAGVSFVIRKVAPQRWLSWQKRRPFITLVVFALVFLYSTVTIVKDTWSVRTVEREVKLPEGYEALSGFRIAQISDVQGDGRTTPDGLTRFVEQINSLRPDLVLFAGDLVTSGTRYIDTSASILGKLRAKYGVIAAIGDHDIFSRKPMVVEALSQAGIAILEDTTVHLGPNSGQIELTIITYTYPQKPPPEILNELLFGGDNTGFKVLLVHQPAKILVDGAAKGGYHLFLAGHTHGGGIAFGIPGLFLFAPADIESPYVSGAYMVGEMLVSVTNGLGFTLAPIRFQAPAEIVLLTLK